MQLVTARRLVDGSGAPLVEAAGLLVEALGSPRAAIQAATSGSAACVGQGDLGTLAPSKLADGLAVDGEPLVDIACLQQVGWVMQGGRIVHAPGQPVGA